MKSIELTQIVHATKATVWKALFTDFADISLHNPGMSTSTFMNNATEGALACSRRCEFLGGMFVEEEITELTEQEKFIVTVTNSSYPPAVKKMFAVYQTIALTEDTTEVRMTLYIKTDPEMVADGILQQMQEPLSHYLIGLNYYIETGIAVTMENFPSILQAKTE